MCIQTEGGDVGVLLGHGMDVGPYYLIPARMTSKLKTFGGSLMVD